MFFFSFFLRTLAVKYVSDLKKIFILTDMHYQTKLLFQANPHCHCYSVVVVVVCGGYGDGGVAEDFADGDVFFSVFVV